MKTVPSLRLVMAPLACCLSLAASGLSEAATSKKTPPAPAPKVMGPPPPKPGFLEKLNPFSKKTPPPPAVAPPAPAQYSKKTPARPGPPRPPATGKPSSKSLANAKIARPTPPPAVVETKKPGFLARVKSGIGLGPEDSPGPTPAPSVQPARDNAKGPGFISRVKSSIGLGPDQNVEPSPSRVAPVANPASNATSREPNKFLTRVKDTLDRDRDALPDTEKPARPGDWKERWVISEDSAGFFEFGPSQANGPDRRLNRGNVVKITSQASRGWTRVELEDGRQGYIGTDQMRQAMETDFVGPSSKPLAKPGIATARLASAGVRPAVVEGWSPMAPLPDLPALPSQGGSDSQLLLPPLEFEGTELKKSSLRLPASDAPTLKPGDAAPTLTLDPESTPVLEEKLELPDLEPIKTELQPALQDDPVEPEPPAPAEAAPSPPPPDLDAPVPVLPPPSEPDVPN